MVDKKLSIGLKLYVCIELLMLLAIRLTEVPGVKGVCNYFMYAAIVVDFLMIMVLYQKGKNNKNIRKHIPIAFFFMLMADTFLCLIDLPEYNLYGYIFFCLVELRYAVYLGLTKRNICVRAVLYIALVAVLISQGMFNPGNAIAIFNIVLLLVNVVVAWIVYRKDNSTQNLLFAIGITLFFVCDFSILIRTLAPMGLFRNIVGFLVWTAYVPAQIFILYSYLEELKENNVL